MQKEREYSKDIGNQHIKSYGQYFTNFEVADFMCKWACSNATSVLDPAVGNSVFFRFAKKYAPSSELIGYEIDTSILDYFGNPYDADIKTCDYLLAPWFEKKFDAIVCNPPYHRFQAISNRDDVLEFIKSNTGVRYSGYTNLYILFLLKSIYQLSEAGKLAYIIPSEFLNSKYGIPIKELLIQNRLLHSIINFENNDELFFNAITTCCIILLDKTPKEHVNFFNLHSVSEISTLDLDFPLVTPIKIKYEDLNPDQKWRSFLNQETALAYRNLVPLSYFCTVTRGIATGANEFFCFSKQKAQQNNIPMGCLSECICRSPDVNTLIFQHSDYEELANNNRTVYLLDVSEKQSELIMSYLEQGVSMGIDKKYLPACRKPWYSMEKKEAADIWVSSACRGTIKFIQNQANVKSLSTFHSIFILPIYRDISNIIFCYFVTPIAQDILRQNRKELGGGLEKFQPNDLNKADMLNLELISDEDKQIINDLYLCLKKNPQSTIDQLNSIFEKYLIPDKT